MLYDTVCSEEEYKKSLAAIKKRIVSSAKESDSEILKEVAKEQTYEKDDERKETCRIVRMLVDDGIEKYEQGEMTYKEMVKDLAEALQAIA